MLERASATGYARAQAVQSGRRRPWPTRRPRLNGLGARQALEDARHLARSVTRRLAHSRFSQDPKYCARRDTASQRTDYHAPARQMGEGWAESLR